MESIGTVVGKPNGFDASQKATMATTNIGSGAQTVPKDNNLDTIVRLLKWVRLIVMGKMENKGLPSMDDANNKTYTLVVAP